MKRVTFMSIAAAFAALPIVRSLRAVASPKPTLKAYEDPEGEVYVAYSAQDLVDDFGKDYDYTAADFREIPRGTILSNDGEHCEGVCINDGSGDHSQHCCVDVDRELRVLQERIDRGEWQTWGAERGTRSRPGMVHQLWTYYD